MPFFDALQSHQPPPQNLSAAPSGRLHSCISVSHHATYARTPVGGSALFSLVGHRISVTKTFKGFYIVSVTCLSRCFRLSNSFAVAGQRKSTMTTRRSARRPRVSGTYYLRTRRDQ